jgi:hypothetical protein
VILDIARQIRSYERALIARFQPTARMVRDDVTEWIRLSAARRRVELDDRARHAVRTLRRDGFAVIEGFWPRDAALALGHELLPYALRARDEEFPGGAYLRVWDKRAYDRGVRRIYRVDCLVPRLEAFRHDPYVMRIVEAYYRRPFYSGVLVFQHNLRSNSDTREYHVDIFGKEFKAFLYLDDVADDNGPFSYIRGSHRAHWTRLRRQLTPRPDMLPTSFSEKEIAHLLRREVRVCAPAGTLILANVRGIHRGSPQISRARSVLVNYIYGHPGDVQLDV